MAVRARPKKFMLGAIIGVWIDHIGGTHVCEHRQLHLADSLIIDLEGGLGGLCIPHWDKAVPRRCGRLIALADPTRLSPMRSSPPNRNVDREIAASMFYRAPVH